ncbi:hypothetical protein E4U21_003559 [Claviceps maximensis]|nr:hypothetical protein E4U21_003559 [Claviceps maximensis]
MELPEAQCPFSSHDFIIAMERPEAQLRASNTPWRRGARQCSECAIDATTSIDSDNPPAALI